MRSLPSAGLYGILDTRWLSLAELPIAGQAYLDGGCDILQLRMKDVSDQERLEAQRAVSAVAEAWGKPVWLVINDRADLAKVLLDESPSNVTPMLHLGQDDIPPKVARDLLGQDIVIGLSTHNPEQVAQACREDVDYLGYGPVYPTPTKANPDPTTGVEGLTLALEVASKPIVAIGGITQESATDLRVLGARWVVVISDLLKGANLMDSGRTDELAGNIMRLQGSLT